MQFGDFEDEATAPPEANDDIDPRWEKLKKLKNGDA
jgi:uncharacterized metal-binding protein YceD (DUF177 family)